MSMKVRIAVVISAVALLAACQGTTARPTGTPSGKTPVIFIYGWNSSSSIWTNALAAFHAAGYTTGDITVFEYDTSQGAADVAPALSDEVDYLRQYTGKSKVDLVTHSFGSTVARSCIELGPCQNKIAHWMSLSGADNGTAVADACLGVQASCRDMAGWNSTTKNLKANWGQITTQGVKVEVQWTSNDGVIIPASNSQELPPAVNIQVSSSLDHHSIYNDAGVLAEIIRFLKT